ncbi:hypothetical protein EK21DRAFT_104427 [Setomelanomma holmii]|uniref:Altered inheritance of mitochondria protein 6 n=1 Tax=Setomelanomma holmii TaxID=210430 RepID=A0A9P4GZD8_9PLEO|nr:hypothetical protein EK21DRAFT_104427 [Setomelanomma holmii]
MDQEKKSGVIVEVRPVYSRMTDSYSLPEREFRDDSDNETGSQVSSAVSLEELESGRSTPRWYRRGQSKTLAHRCWAGLRSSCLGTSHPAKRSLGQQWFRLTIVVISVLGVFGVIAGVGLEHIVSTWKEPDANGTFKYEWMDNFSRDIVTKNCHSHNDYWRRVPLYQAFAAGCTSIEADVWLTDDKDLRVGHSWQSTTQYRTLHNLFLDPLTNIFENRNVSTASMSDRQTGVFDSDPNASVILLIDVKSDGHDVWPVLQSQLQSFHDKNWLTYFDGKAIHQGPLTVVGTGRTPFELVQQNSTDRFIFYDAPLRSISESQYTIFNSYYASANLKAAVGSVWWSKFNSKQEDTLEQQIEAAQAKGLKSRYWDTPAWPISSRDNVWAKLMDLGVGVLNVDDLVSATRWNWDFCEVAGFKLCGKKHS